MLTCLLVRGWGVNDTGCMGGLVVTFCRQVGRSTYFRSDSLILFLFLPFANPDHCVLSPTFNLFPNLTSTYALSTPSQLSNNELWKSLTWKIQIQFPESQLFFTLTSLTLLYFYFNFT